MGDRASDRHEVFMGAAQQPSPMVSHADLQLFGAGLLHQFCSLLEGQSCVLGKFCLLQYDWFDIALAFSATSGDS